MDANMCLLWPPLDTPPQAMGSIFQEALAQASKRVLQQLQQRGAFDPYTGSPTSRLQLPEVQLLTAGVLHLASIL